MKCNFCEKESRWFEEVEACEVCGGSDCGDFADIIYYCEDCRKWFDIKEQNLKSLI